MFVTLWIIVDTNYYILKTSPQSNLPLFLGQSMGMRETLLFFWAWLLNPLFHLTTIYTCSPCQTMAGGWFSSCLIFLLHFNSDVFLTRALSIIFENSVFLNGKIHWPSCYYQTSIYYDCNKHILFPFPMPHAWLTKDLLRFGEFGGPIYKQLNSMTIALVIFKCSSWRLTIWTGLWNTRLTLNWVWQIFRRCIVCTLAGRVWLIHTTCFASLEETLKGICV